MTKELRTFIELSDIQGIELECPHCGVRILNTLDRAEAAIGYGCPSCNQGWFGGQSDAQLRTVGGEQMKQLVRLIKLLTAERGDLLVKLKLHVANLQEG